jgi:hypothetical protein
MPRARLTQPTELTNVEFTVTIATTEPGGPHGNPAVARGARLCISCAVDPCEGDHLSWCPDAMPSIGEAARDARDLEAAIAWQPPKLDLPKLSPPEREQLARLFAARIRARGWKPRRLWSIKEWRNHVARTREGAA